METTIIGKDGLKTTDLNRRKATHEKCLDCSCWSYTEVTGCHRTKCPLYPFRNGRGKQDAGERSKAIRSYCIWCMAGQSIEVGKCTAVTCPLFVFRKT